MRTLYNSLLLVLLILSVSLSFSCRKKTICPAYNSAFILGEDEQLQYLTQFTDDSIPELKESLRTFMEKNEFGIVVNVKKKKKWKLINFIPMHMILPLVDSTMMDSTGQIMGPGYNRDMIVYNRKFGDLLIEPKAEVPDSTQIEEDGKKKKKKKKKKDEEEEVEDLETDDPDYDPWSGGDDANW
jgi:hypothetical protein